MIIRFNNEKLNPDEMEQVGIKKIRGINPVYFIYFMEGGQEKLLDTTQTSDEIKIANELDEIARNLYATGKWAYVRYRLIINLEKTKINNVEIKKTITNKYYLKITLLNGKVVKTTKTSSMEIIQEQFKFASSQCARKSDLEVQK